MVLLPQPNSKAMQVLRLLAEGDATTGELAAETGWKPKLVAAHLSQHANAGRVSHRPFSSRNGKRWIWSLTEKGSTYLRSIAPGATPGAASGPAPTS